MTRGSPAYRSWASMKSRCRDAKQGCYQKYGAKGITYCPEWESYDRFLADMGDRPLGTTLDRIDRSGNYKPGNCRWATPKEQAYNRSTTILLTIDGETKCVRDWGKEYNIDPSVIRYRRSQGWSDEDAVKAPRYSNCKARGPRLGHRLAWAKVGDATEVKE